MNKSEILAFPKYGSRELKYEIPCFRKNEVDGFGARSWWT